MSKGQNINVFDGNAELVSYCGLAYSLMCVIGAASICGGVKCGRQVLWVCALNMRCTLTILISLVLFFVSCLIRTTVQCQQGVWRSCVGQSLPGMISHVHYQHLDQVRHTHTHLYTHTHTYTHAYTHTHIHTHTCMHTHTHIHTHTCNTVSFLLKV